MIRICTYHVDSGYKYILSLICFPTMNFTEQYYSEGKAGDVRCEM